MPKTAVKMASVADTALNSLTHSLTLNFETLKAQFYSRLIFYIVFTTYEMNTHNTSTSVFTVLGALSPFMSYHMTMSQQN